MAVRWLAFSDLHLDAPFAQGGSDLTDLRRSELRRTLQKTVELAGELQVDALACAGDLYEHERYTPDTAAMLQRLFAEVAPVPVLVSPGNHDWYGPSSIYATASWSPNVHVFDSDRLTPWDGLDGVRVWGLAHRAPSGAGDPLAGLPTQGEGLHVGLFHGSESSGWEWARREDAKKQRHAPFSADQIEAGGLDHCVVGHYHKRVEGDRHTYPGAPTALSFDEPGDGGAVEIHFDPGGDEPPKRTWHKVSSLEVHVLKLDVTGCGDMSEIGTKMSDLLAPLEGIARVTLVGDLGPAVDLNLKALGENQGRLDHLDLRADVRPGYDLDAIKSEPTAVRGEFVRAVLADTSLSAGERSRVITVGLRALEGRKDLEVV